MEELTKEEIEAVYYVLDEYKDRNRLNSFVSDSFWTAYDKFEDEFLNNNRYNEEE